MGAMAEYFVGPVMEKIIDKCFEYLSQTRMKEELQKLRDIHPQIQVLVSSYSQAHIEDPALNKWLWQLRDAVDEADDVLDDLLEYYKRKHEERVSTIKRKRKADLLEHALEIGNNEIEPNMKRLEEIVQKLYEISAKVSTFGHILESTKQQQLEMRDKRETGSMPSSDLFGRSNEMEFVKQWLRNPCSMEITNTGFYRNISVLSVVGHGEMGKTTLLQHVYTDGMTEEFDVKIWVCVSTNFKAKTVISNMLKFLKRQVSDEEPLAALQSSLQSEVMYKRFLLVLDDIWEEDEGKWENVLAPLRYGSSGSKILITTRLDTVASNFAKIIRKSKDILRLKSLKQNECWRLFNSHAFAGVDNPSDEFISIAGEIVEKLSGCPLAAKVIGGILNDYIDERYWKKVLNTNIGNVGSNQNHLLPILKLSYIYLPKFLQNCFAFCSIFPKDHKFDKDDLVRMWIALGFIQSSNISGETLEETGRRYFNILVQKSFFDEFCAAYNEKVYYKMHDLLHEMVQSISTQECFKVVGNNEFPTPPESIRHLSITVHSSGIKAVVKKMEKFKKLRSLFLFFNIGGKYDENAISEILKASKSIRLLVISTKIYSKMSETFMPETIGCLVHLRYLKFECINYSNFCKRVRLPRSITQLYHLQFIISNELQILEMNSIGWKACNCLIIDEVFTKDPYVFRSINSLRCLTIEKNDELVSFPAETEQWLLQHTSSLWRLKFYRLKSLQSLPSFESLSSLEQLELYYLDSLQCLPSSLSTISSLTHLTLENIPLLKSLPDLPSSLQYIELANLISLQCLPSSLSTISSLKYLTLKNILLLKSLPDLPSSLKVLELEELQSLQCLPSFLHTTLLNLTIYKVPRLLELPDLPSSLENLLLRNLESLQCLPSCFHTSLPHLTIDEIPRLLELPVLPSSLKTLCLRKLGSLQCLPSSLPTLTALLINKVPRLLELPGLPLSLELLELIELESLQCLPSYLPGLDTLIINKVPRLLELPDLPPTLKLFELRELESLQCLPSYLPALDTLIINKVPRLLELPDLPASFLNLSIEDCHPQLMERYEDFDVW